MLRTTINMKKSVYKKICLAAVKLDTSKREVVIMLLTRIRYSINDYQGGFTLVNYQPRDPRKRWHCFTIKYKEHENELVSDFRRLGKFSVSYFIAKAVRRYLKKMLNDGEKGHNYVKLNHYAIGQSMVDGIICWKYYWGDPGTPLKDRTSLKILRSTGRRRPLPT